MRRLLALAVALLVPACSTGPDEPLVTILVKFGRPPSESDLGALAAVGGRVQHRIELAGAVTMRADASAAAEYALLPGVHAAGVLGPEEDPDVSVFITTDGPPTAEDVAFVRATGARSAHAVPGEVTIGAVLPLGRVSELADRIRFLALDIVIEPLQTQP